MTTYHVLRGDTEKVNETADRVARQIKENINSKYQKEFPFFNNKEFKDVTKGIISISDNSYCLTGCRSICCPKECDFFSEKLDSCGIYDFRSISCRLFFCGNSEYPTVLKKVYDIFHSEVAWNTASDIVENEVDDKPSSFKRIFDSAKTVKENLESGKMPPEKAKHEWRKIIIEYRNRKI